MKIIFIFLLPNIFLQNQTIQEGSATQSGSVSTENNQVTCNLEMMSSYGLTGQQNSHNRVHKYCPMVTKNCCTPQDDETSLQLWNTQSRRIIEKHYETYLFSLKYILGYSVEGVNLAEDLLSSDNLDCRRSAEEYKSMNMNLKITEDIYRTFVNSLEEIANLRKGFYCIMCDANSQEKLADYWASTNLFYHDRVYFSQDFCRKLVESTIRSSYFKVFYLKKFADSLAQMITCKTGVQKIEFEIPFWTTQQVKNCYYFKDKYFFFFCERYCEKFHLVKPDEIFDGEIKQLKKFVDLIMENKNEVFDYPSNNILMFRVTYEEDLLKNNFDLVLSETNFFVSAGTVKLDQFVTDTVYFGGMDPWDSCQNSLYELAIASSKITSLFYFLVLAFL